MKKVFLLLPVIIILGCIGYSKTSINFDDKYSEIKNVESNVNLSDVKELDNLNIYLSNLKQNLKSDNDSLALKEFIEFRLALLNAQKEIILAENDINNSNCIDARVRDYLTNATNNAKLAIQYIDKFNNTFPEYINRTNITKDTITKLELLVNKTTYLLNKTELNESCS